MEKTVFSSQEKEIKINNLYSIQQDSELGSGSFGKIIKGINIKTKEEVAIKFEPMNTQTPQLQHEYKILKMLNQNEGFPQVYYFSPFKDTFVMVMELLGQNLDTLMLLQKQKHFTLKTSLLLTLQILKRIQSLHEANFIHRDIKPENFLVGLKKKSSTIYMIDYGLTRKFYENKTHSHIPYREGKGITGTVKFASIYTHMGIEQSRRDDLESLGYLMVYFMKGELPWMNLKYKNKKERDKKIKEKKIEVVPVKLCEGLDEYAVKWFEYVRKLQFEEEPNYKYLEGIILDWMKKEKIVNDLEFDWSEKRGGSKNNCLFSNSNNNDNSGGNIMSAESLFSKLKLGFNNNSNKNNKSDTIEDNTNKENIINSNNHIHNEENIDKQNDNQNNNES